jgi:catalase
VEPTGEELVDAIEAVSGSHVGRRRAHASGIVATGTFTPTPAAAELSTATLLRGPTVGATVRFSNGTGAPDTRDDAPDGRGIAVKLGAEDDTRWDLIGITLPQFFVRTAPDFVGLMAARVPDPETGELDMAKVGAFLGEHPEALPALEATMTMAVPASYAEVTYNGLHTFFYVGADGTRTAVRHSWVPDADAATLPDERAEDHLRAEMGERLAKGPVGFTLRLTLAADGDPLDDPTVRWPEDRPTVDAGHLEITALAPDQVAADAAIFDPTNVPAGVECSDDQILHARSRAYGVSYARRRADA